MNRELFRTLLAGREFVLRREQRLERPLDDVFPFFAAAENLGVITPHELQFRIRTPLPIEMKTGALIDYTIRLHGVPMLWRTQISDWSPPHRFVDQQLRGPYRQWIHTHTFEADGDATVIRDEVRYRLPFGILGSVVQPLIARQLKRIFDHRHTAIEQHFSRR